MIKAFIGGLPYMSNLEKTKKPCHLKEMLRNGYALYALLLTAILTTVSVIAIDFDYLSTFRAIPGLKYYLAITFSLIGLTVLLYLIFRAKTKCVSFADCIANTMFLSAGIVGAYAYFLAKKGTLAFFIIDGAILVIGLFFSILFAIRREKRNEKREIIFTKNSMVGYYTSVFRKYRFIGVLSLAILSVSGSFLLFNSGFLGFATQFIKDTPLLRYLIIVSIVIFGAWLAIDASRQRVSVIDAFLLSNIVTIPVTFAQIYFMNELNLSQLTAWAIYIGVILIVSLVRFLSFDITVNYTQKDLESKTYVSAFFKKVNPLAILAVAALIITVSVFCYVSNVYGIGVVFEESKLTIFAIEMWPLTAITFAGAATVVVGFLMSLLCIGAKRVCVVDFFVNLNLILGICACIGYIWIPEFIYILVAGAWTFINLTLLGIRAKVVRRNLNRPA